MKLRNKKTGEIVELKLIQVNDKYLEDHEVNLLNGEKLTLKLLADSFDDVKDPLIKDEKIRKAVRVWADANRRDLFRVINLYKPNFCEIWNMRFDIQYLYYRIIALGYDPSSVMCHNDFKNKKCYFKLDRSTFLIEKQFDYFYCSSSTQHICQMRLNII